jgi:hypothetical protein
MHELNNRGGFMSVLWMIADMDQCEYIIPLSEIAFIAERWVNYKDAETEDIDEQSHTKGSFIHLRCGKKIALQEELPAVFDMLREKYHDKFIK